MLLPHTLRQIRPIMSPREHWHRKNVVIGNHWGRINYDWIRLSVQNAGVWYRYPLVPTLARKSCW
jgi:hypothetical protein